MNRHISKIHLVICWCLLFSFPRFLLDIYEVEGRSVNKKQIDKIPLLLPKVRLFLPVIIYPIIHVT